MSDAGYLLVAEDDPDDLMLIRRAAAHVRPCLRVEAVRDGGALMDYLSAQQTDALPAAVLLDLNMPRVSGREFLRRLQQQDGFLACAIVVFTTSTDAREREQIMAMGADEFWTKPDSFSELVQFMQGLLERWIPGAGNEATP